jgi:hypothetical protein
MKDAKNLIANGLLVAILVTFAERANAQGNFVVTQDDIPKLKLNHYFTPDKKSHDADFEWTFTKTGFTIKKGKGPIPTHIANKLLPEGTVADQITGDWALKEGQLRLSKIRAGGKDGKKQVDLSIFKTAPSVVRLCDPDQLVFEMAGK